jgi:hypothetical protein
MAATVRLQSWPRPSRRALARGALLLAVWAAHQALIGAWQSGLQRTRPRPDTPPTAPAWRLLALPAPMPEPDSSPSPSPDTRQPTPPPRPEGVQPPPTRRPPRPALARPDAAGHQDETAPPPAGAASLPPTPTEPQAADEDGARAAPPRYPTRVPPPARWRFTVQRGGASGEGVWDWSVADGRYRSHLQAVLDGRPLLDQSSEGALDADGLAPERLLERGRGRSARAVNFQRERALVSFSGSRRAWALWPATQDGLSWLPQLLAVLAARPGWAAGDTLRLAVARADGELASWDWRLEDTRPWQGHPAWHWVREPDRPYDHRIELWLDPHPPHWPRAWRWQRVPGGEPVLWTRTDPEDERP